MAKSTKKEWRRAGDVRGRTPQAGPSAATALPFMIGNYPVVESPFHGQWFLIEDTTLLASARQGNMQSYRKNKLRTLFQMVQRIHNWQTAFTLRLFRGRCAGSYGQAFDFVSRRPAGANVLDLGGNIGLFSLTCARRAQ